MSAIKPIKKYRELILEKDENLNAILIYGKNDKTERRDLVCWYGIKRGFEALYSLKSVLTQQQIKTVREWIHDFNPKFEVQL